MNITFRQLQVFEAVAQNLSYTKAAQALHMTQPAASMQIKQLEDSIGLPLFEQLGKKLYLTEAGKELFQYAQSISRQISEAELVFDEMKGTRRGQLNIAVASTANYFATGLLADFCKRYSGITFSLDVTNREGLLRQLKENTTDLVIMGKPPAALDLTTEAFMENPLVVIATPNHPLTTRKNIPIDELQKETFVVREKGSGTRIAMERFFKDRDIRLRTGMEMSSNEAIKQAVEAGLGLGIVSSHTLTLELETGRLCILDVEGFPILRHWYLVHRTGKRLSPVAQQFRQFLLDEVGSSVQK